MAGDAPGGGEGTRNRPRPSRSMDRARDFERQSVAALEPEERIALALALGRRSAALRELATEDAGQ